MKTTTQSERTTSFEKYEAAGKQTDQAELSEKERELAAVAISVAAGCRPCTSYHVDAVRKTGATIAETEHALAEALRIRRRAASAMSEHASKRLVRVYGEPELRVDRESESGAGDGIERASEAAATEVLTPRVCEIVAIGAAFAVNCTETLEQHLISARSVGVSDDEIEAVARLAAFIKLMAASPRGEDGRTGRARQTRIPRTRGRMRLFMSLSPSRRGREARSLKEQPRQSSAPDLEPAPARARGT